MSSLQLQRPQFHTPNAPDVRPIIELHRGNDGHVAFTRRNASGQFEKIASVPSRQLEQLFPQFIAPLVDQDSFYTINAMYQPGYGQSRLVPELRAAKWGSTELRWLTACYVDFDFYKRGMTIGQALGVLVDAQEQGTIPPASLITNSGRGMWAFWMLRNDDDASGPIDGPARAWAENVACYKRIERQLTRMFESIEPDHGARDAARITRIPGSLNRMAQARVGYWFQLSPSGTPFVYTLNELAALLSVAPCKLPKGMRGVLNPAMQARARSGYQALWAQRLAKLVKLFAHRGRVHEGCRNRAALLLAVCMHKCRIETDEIIDTVGKFGLHQCEPPLTVDEIRTVIADRKKFAQFADVTIADWLKITREESELIGWPHAGSGSAQTDAATRTRADARQARREIIGHVWRVSIEGRRSPPTLDQLHEHLDRVGLGCSLQTISKDLVELGLTNPRRHRRDDPQPGELLLTGPTS